MLKVSSFYHEKQKSFIPKKNIFYAVVSKYVKIDPKDLSLTWLAVLIFSEGFALSDEMAKLQAWFFF